MLPACRARMTAYCLLSLLLVAALPVSAKEPAPIDFSRDIRPILSQHCFACHGPDEGSREAGLRLDRADAALAELESGTTAVVPGDPDASELLVRITAEDADLRMPPASTGHTLTPEQIDHMRRWIAEGANYDEHWSFRPVLRPRLPDVQNSAWTRNPIDHFVLARLEQEGIVPSPEAARETLLRRLSLDLLGLPPEPAEVIRFLEDASPDAYDRAVDRLLASPHFGERWGRHWLDVAHYADSDGYLGDAMRPYAWLYRDWVIDAVNRDLPFDQFTIEQLAGDLLPAATLDQKTATGFLRNTLRNTEAGVDLEEYRLKEIVDRVSTVGIGWLGLSLGCAECHSHKYDPISHREFYELFSFFNNADDIDLPAPQPGEEERYTAQLERWSKTDKELSQSIGTWLSEHEDSASDLDEKSLLIALSAESRKRTADQKKLLERIKKSSRADLQELTTKYERHAAAKPKPPATKVMTIARRETDRISYVHLRGDYRSRGEDVAPGTPAVLPPLQPRGSQADRLDFARWLVDPANPLTPRVTVNHLWQHLFGRGLVATVDNFGSGGEPPSHPQLLDWLAQEMLDQGWSRKEMIRLMVTSATYRQASHGRSELDQRDPLNVLLARQARFRLEAEAVRDAALVASGLLERKIGGPGIRPPQPAYVTSISRNAEWKVTTGADLYRRGSYIVFRRATPYPMLLTFDAPDSTVACVRRERSNSPLQALTLLNDPVFFECALALGRDLAGGPPRSVEERLRDGFLRCVGRTPQPEELARLRALFEEQRERFSANEAAALAIVGGQAESTTKPGDVVEQAAWIVTARILMNLDEFITRE